MISHRSPAFLRGNGGASGGAPSARTAVRPSGQVFGSKATSSLDSQFSPSPSIIGQRTVNSQATGQQTIGPQSAVSNNALLQNVQSLPGFTSPQPAAQYSAVATTYNVGNLPVQQQPAYPPADTGIPWSTIAVGGAIGIAAIIAIALLFPAQPAA